MKKERKDVLRNRAEYVGKRFQNKQGCWGTIIAYRHAKDLDFKFDSGVVIYNRRYSRIKTGAIKDPLHPIVYNTGYIGNGKHKSRDNGEITTMYSRWHNALYRCYCLKALINQPTYKDCKVDSNWHNFQVFGDWFEENYKPEYMDSNWHLDKDILFKGNKLYSSETCCLVPREINALFIKSEKTRGDCPIGVHYDNEAKKFCAQLSVGEEQQIPLGYFDTAVEAFEAYKPAKEEYIKLVANKWRGQITEPCYHALMNYEVDIND